MSFPETWNNKIHIHVPHIHIHVPHIDIHVPHFHIHILHILSKISNKKHKSFSSSVTSSKYRITNLKEGHPHCVYQNYSISKINE